MFRITWERKGRAEEWRNSSGPGQSGDTRPTVAWPPIFFPQAP